MSWLWLTMLVAGLLTYAIRLSFIQFFARREIPLTVKRALRFVPPAVLTALFFPELLLPAGQLDLSLGNSRLLAGLLASLVAWRTKNAFLTILVGMAALLLLQGINGK
ncbi:MAG TPA: AzlD domain-containing protein [Anaerolineales bacterium]|nr:AzlD domain-containing protein [Anaerolineales bacterium]